MSGQIFNSGLLRKLEMPPTTCRLGLGAMVRGALLPLTGFQVLAQDDLEESGS